MAQAIDHAADEAALTLVQRFYDAFARRDGDGMAACYAPEARFADPAFGELRDGDPGRMWQMLCIQGQDLRVVLDRVQQLPSSPQTAVIEAQWTATYTFSLTRRRVVNVVVSRIEVDRGRGLIVSQDDQFDFWRWSRQALGIPGALLGWSRLLQDQVRKQALKGLRKFTQARDTGERVGR